jgi:hypothetical protein
MAQAPTSSRMTIDFGPRLMSLIQDVPHRQHSHVHTSYTILPLYHASSCSRESPRPAMIISSHQPSYSRPRRTQRCSRSHERYRPCFDCSRLQTLEQRGLVMRCRVPGMTSPVENPTPFKNPQLSVRPEDRARPSQLHQVPLLPGDASFLARARMDVCLASPGGSNVVKRSRLARHASSEEVE